VTGSKGQLCDRLEMTVVSPALQDLCPSPQWERNEKTSPLRFAVTWAPTVLRTTPFPSRLIQGSQKILWFS